MSGPGSTANDHAKHAQFCGSNSVRSLIAAEAIAERRGWSDIVQTANDQDEFAMLCGANADRRRIAEDDIACIRGPTVNDRYAKAHAVLARLRAR